jgi:asparagine synthase (glutamine-hydrolysing)
MCGISGYFSRKRTIDFSVELNSSREKQAYRGPDDQGVWSDDQAGLAHSRLAIIDLSPGGHQPMYFEEEGLHMVFNGEIYNYIELKSELQLKGVEFKTDSDSEVILRGFMLWGSDLFPKLNGMFAIAIYNPDSKELILARDRFGIKPLYYFVNEEHCFFASELNSILSFPIERKLNYSALSNYFRFSYIPDNESIIEGISQLEPGKLLRIDKNTIKDERYYSIDSNPIDISYPEALNEIKKQLEQSVERRLLADVPVATFLSSGLDSTIISKIASQKSPRIHAYSAGFSEFPYFDESKLARQWANKNTIDHSIINLSQQELIESVDELLNALSEPFADSSAIAYHALSKQVSKEVKVVLSGDGADELFGGYRKHKAEWLLRKKPLIRKIAGSFTSFKDLSIGSRNSALGNYKRQIGKLAHASRLSNEERYIYWASLLSDAELSSLINANKSRVYKADFTIKSMNDFLLKDMQMLLPGDMLYKADRSSMLHGLEVRVPYLDHHLVNLVFSLPSEWKLKNGKRKSLLKDSFKEQLPVELLRRKKKGFEVPLQEWLKGPLKEKVDRVLNEEVIREQGILNFDEVNRVIERSRGKNTGDAPYQVWAMLVFQTWVNNYNPIC